MGSHLPGVEQGLASSSSEVLFTEQGSIRIGGVIDGDRSVDGGSPTATFDLRPGRLMGTVTSTGRWTPCRRTRTRSAASGFASSAAGDYSIVPVDDASSFRAGDVISVGADTNLTIQSVDYANNLITVDDPIEISADELVVASDGSETCRGILLDFVRLRRDDGTGPAHRSASILVQGMVKTSAVLGDLATVRLDTSAPLAGIRFTDEHGLG